MSTRKSGPPPIVFILLLIILASAGYYWFAIRKPAPSVDTSTPVTPTKPQPTDSYFPPPFPPPESVPGGLVVRINGSTSMVKINQKLKIGFQNLFPGTVVATQASGSSKGIEALLAGRVDLAASSRPLTYSEESQDLVAVPVATDAIAIVIGIANPIPRGLTQAEIRGIFQGDITDWSAVGGPPGKIRVINRPSFSGTHQMFKELILHGDNFGTTGNITTMDRDATTPMLQKLGADGIGYATYDQIKNQSTVRPIAVDGTTPNMDSYLYQRTLYYVYKNPPNQAVEAFLGYAFSPPGKQAVADADS